jgi:hypothetical protein
MVARCGTEDRPPDANPCGGLVDLSDSAAFVRYSVGTDQYWDVTLAMLQNPCAHSLEVVGLDVGAEMGIAGQGASLVNPPEQVFAAAPAEPVALPPLEPFRVPAGGKVQVIGRFEVAGDTLVHVPTATLRFRNGGQPGTLTLTPTVSLCTCGPPH